jgi:hypothetical protein
VDETFSLFQKWFETALSLELGSRPEGIPRAEAIPAHNEAEIARYLVTDGLRPVHYLVETVEQDKFKLSVELKGFSPNLSEYALGTYASSQAQEMAEKLVHHYDMNNT